MFPEPLPEGPAYDELVTKVRANELINGKLISPDGTLALVVLALEPDVASSSKSGAIVQQIRDAMNQDLEGSDLKGELAGVPVMQLEIHNSVERDRVIYNLIGFNRRLPDRDPVLPAHLVHARRGGAAARRHPHLGRRARLARFPAQHLPQRDDGR